MILAIIRIENCIDIITNSSSELFVIKADKKKEIIFEMVKDALSEITPITLDSLEPRIFEGEHNTYEEDWMLNDFLAKIPEYKREEIKNQLSQPNYYGLVFDRDWAYRIDYRHHEKLKELGFELLTSDY